MKKLPVLFSVLLMAALVLAACGGANGNGNNVNETPGVGTGTDVVPETGGEVDTTATVEVAEPTATEAVAEATATEAVAEATATEAVAETTATEAVADATETEAAATAPAEGEGAAECRPYQLTSYLDFEVIGADGENIGEVDGIVVHRDAAMAPATGAPDFSNFTAGQYANPVVTYFVIDFDDAAGFGDSETLVPFGAFTALNEQTAVEDCELVFASSYELNNFPVWDWDARPDLADENWDNEFEAFWTNLGVNVTRTAPGGQQLGNPIVFRDNFDDIDVLNLNNDDLGEIEDFIIDPATGEIRYAALAAGGFLGIGEKVIPVPMNQVMWGHFDDDADDLGEIYINHPDDGWENAPEIDLDGVDFGNSDWDTEFETYWNNLNVTQ